jgi:hypothetical protein
VLLILIAAIYAWGLWRFFTQQVPGGNDFLANCLVWEPYLREGISPYSDEAALYVQRIIYGRPALPGEDQNRLVYPFYSIVLHGPFVYLPYSLARAIYMTLLQAALCAGVIMSLDLVRWRPPKWLLAAVLAWSLLFYPQARGVILGQFAIFGFFSLAATLYFLENRRDFLAGALLVLSTIKPTLVFLVVPFLMLWAIIARRWRFLGGFLSTLAVLVLGSLIALPTWVSEWFHRISAYSDYTVGHSPIWLFAHVYVRNLGSSGETALALLLLIGTVASWWLAFYSRKRTQFYWALGMTLLVSNLIVPRSATTNYVMLLIPLLWGFAVLDRSGRWGKFGLVTTMLISGVGLWWLHFATVMGNQEQPIMFIPIPVASGVILLCGRSRLVHDPAMRDRLIQGPHEGSTSGG